MTEKELQKVFTSNIREHRNRLNWSQVNLAKKSGVSINFISDIEAGKKWASPVTMIKLANAFGIETYELLKPQGIFPDNFNSIINKYTEIIHNAVDEARLSFKRPGETPQKK